MNIAKLLLIGCFHLAGVSLYSQQLIVRSTPMEAGTIQGGQRVGIWNYFDSPGVLGVAINYDTRKMLHLASDSSEFLVEQGGRWVRERLHRPCRILGSNWQLFEHYKSTVLVHRDVYPRAKRKEQPIVTRITFVVRPDGRAADPVVTGFKGYGMDKLMLTAFQSAPNVWIPGIRMDGTLATCRFDIVVVVCPLDPTTGSMVAGSIPLYPDSPSAIIQDRVSSGVPCTYQLPGPDSLRVLYEFSPSQATDPKISRDFVNARNSKQVVKPYHPFESISPRKSYSESNSYEISAPESAPYDTPGGKVEQQNESSGIQFSPNGRKIALDVSLLTGGSQGLLVAPIDPGEFVHIDCGTILNVFWLDDFNVAFKYQFGKTQPLHSLYDHSTGVLFTRKDSITYFDRISDDRSMICLARPRDQTQNALFVVKMSSLEREQLQVTETLRPIPVSWSPHNKTIILKGRKDKVDELLLYSFAEHTFRLLPVLNADVCGWSADDRTVYVMRTNLNKRELFSIDTESMVVTELGGKVSNLDDAKFSPNANKFLLRMKGNLYLRGAEPHAQPIKIVPNVSAANWSPDGRQIAYVSEQGNLFCVYDVSNGRSTILINRTRP